MKFLFIVQGEGRGHLTQALTLEESLLREGHTVVGVLVGKSRSRQLPAFFQNRIKAPVHRFESPNFLPTPANRKNNLTGSILYNLCKVPSFARSIRTLHRYITESGADMVINFYELLTGLTYLCYRPQIPFICIGHQYLFLHPDFKFPRVNAFQLTLLKVFTRITALRAQKMLALSFRKLEDDKEQHLYVVPPLLRKEAMQQTIRKGNYIHGYMVNSGFASQVTEWHRQHPETPLHFFWDRAGETADKAIDSTLTFHPLDDRAFLSYMSGCQAYASTAGFESICEAMYMGKPILMVPAHIEQECNAYDAMCSNAGIISQDFCLEQLLQFSREYRPNTEFAEWTEKAPQLISNLLLHDGTEACENTLRKGGYETIPLPMAIHSV